MLWGEMTSPAIDRAAQAGCVAIIPTACVEDHGKHLPVDTDIRLCREIVERAAGRIANEVVVLPIISHGYDPHHMDFPGPTSVSGPTFLAYLVDVCMSVLHHGFTRVLIVNGHGSNGPWIEAAGRAVTVAGEGRALCGSLSYWALPELRAAARAVMTTPEVPPGHAGEFETSMYLALRPELVDMDHAEDEPPDETRGLGLGDNGLTLWPHWSSFTQYGVYGYARAATAEKGAALIEGAVSGLTRLLREFRQRPIAPRIDHHGWGAEMPPRPPTG